MIEESEEMKEGMRSLEWAVQAAVSCSVWTLEINLCLLQEKMVYAILPIVLCHLSRLVHVVYSCYISQNMNLKSSVALCGKLEVWNKKNNVLSINIRQAYTILYHACTHTHTHTHIGEILSIYTMWVNDHQPMRCTYV